MRLGEWYEQYKKRLIEGRRELVFAHEILYEALVEDGVEYVDDTYVRLKSIEETGIYGIYPVVNAVFQFLKSAKSGFDTRKRLLVLVGPPSSAKSSLVSAMKIVLEEYTKKNPVAVIKGCPVHDNPLYAVPYNVRNELIEYGIRIENEILPCPVCRSKLKEADWRDLEVEYISFSRSFEIGFGEYAPQDPNTADDSLLVGKMSLSKIAEYGDDSPYAWDYSGVFQKGNRGIVEFVEILKAKIEHLHMLLTASQDQKVVLGRSLGPMYLDLVIIGHTNAPEFERFVSDPKNDALRDRMLIVPANYNLDYEVEEKILRKLVPVPREEISDPLIFKTAAFFTVATRIVNEERDADIRHILENLRWSNTSEEAVHLRKKAFSEGWGSGGFSSRQIANLLTKLYTNKEQPCSFDLLESLEELSSGDSKEADLWKIALSLTREKLAEDVKDVLIDVFVGGSEEDIQNTFQTFFRNLQAIINKKEEITVGGKKYPVDKDLVHAIVSAAGYSTTIEDLKDVYLKITTIMSERLTSGGSFDVKSDLPFVYRAIQKFMFKEKIRLVGGTLNIDVPVEEMKGIVRTLIDSLVKEYGYSPEGARKLVKNAADLIKKELS